MARIKIFEGARCTGKTGITRKLRQSGLNYSTLINFTGFGDDGEEGLKKASDYYRAWMDLFFRLERTDITFIADRIFFSEMVFSRLYKQYDFARHYMQFSHDIASLNDVEIFFFTVGEADLTDRLKRNKMEFFGVEDNVKEIMKQQREYTNMFAQFVTDYPQVKFHLINTSGWTEDEVYQLVLNKIGGNNDGIISK